MPNKERSLLLVAVIVLSMLLLCVGCKVKRVATGHSAVELNRLVSEMGGLTVDRSHYGVLTIDRVQIKLDSTGRVSEIKAEGVKNRTHENEHQEAFAAKEEQIDSTAVVDMTVKAESDGAAWMGYIVWIGLTVLLVAIVVAAIKFIR